ncbi:MAG: hypothetical protein AAF386_08340, partial [Pseudomonadota bacterium]
MKRIIVLIFLVAGCNQPSLDFAGVDPVEVTIDQSTFRIWRVEDRAEALRTNVEWAPNWRHTYIRFARAFQAATGCTVRPRTMQGDQSVMQARLDCPFPTRPNPGRETEVMSCYVNSFGDGFDCETRQ